MEPDPNRGSFDASAYPSLAELVVRYSTHETRLALRHLSMSWHKEVTRYFCRALDLKADRIGWRGLSLVSPHFKGNGEFAHIWRNDGYGEINDSFDLVSVISGSGEDGDGRDGSDMAPIPRLVTSWVHNMSARKNTTANCLPASLLILRLFSSVSRTVFTRPRPLLFTVDFYRVGIAS